MLKRLALRLAPKINDPFYGLACNWRWFRRAVGGRWENWILDQPVGGEHWFQAVPGQSRPHPLCRGTPTVEDYEPPADPYPNLSRAVEADDSIRPQLALLQYLSDHGYAICRKSPDGAWTPCAVTPFMWVYAVNGLDPAKVKEEAFALYHEARRMEGDEEVDG